MTRRNDHESSFVIASAAASGGIARWTERYLEWCNGKHDVAVVNTALQGERAGEAGKQRKLTDEIKRALYVIRETNKGLKRKTDIFISIHAVRDLVSCAIGYAWNWLTRKRCP